MSKSSKKPSDFTEKAPCNQSRFQVAKALCEKNVLLTDWWLIEVESNSKGKRLGVAGRPSRERLAAMRVFESTAIIKRHDAITLETEDGISITITNGINMFRTLQNGFPREVCNHFLSGFPFDWKEFSDKCVGKKPTSSSTCDVNGVASSIDDLPVAHVRDILMLSSGDFARSLIEKCISCHIPRKQEDYAEKDDVNCAQKEAKRKRQEDDVNDVRFVAGDLSDDATPRTKSASIDPSNATTHKDDDTNENSRLASDYFSDDASLKNQDVSKVEESSNDVSGVLCLMDTKKATARKEDDTNEKSRLVSDYLSDDATLKTQDASIFEVKRKDICSRNTKKVTTCKEDDTNKKSRLRSGDLPGDATPRTKGASIGAKNATTHKDRDTNENFRLVSGDLSDNATLKTQHVSKFKENSDDVSGMMTGILCLTDTKKATARKEDDTNGKSRFVSDDLSDDKGHALCSRNTKNAIACNEDTNKKIRLESGDLSDDATPSTPKTNKIEGKSDDKGDALSSTDLIKEKTPKAKVTRSNNKTSSRRVTRSMSRSEILPKRRQI